MVFAPSFMRSSQLYAYPCGPCGRDTPHRHGNCCICHAMSDNPRVVGKVKRKKLATIDAAKGELPGYRYARRAKRVSDAKREYLARQAEESRRKFEGPR